MRNFKISCVSLVLLCTGVNANSASCQEEAAVSVAKPTIAGDYVNVYRPAGDVFPGPDTAGLITGRFYEEWVVNDHCFVRDVEGRWHAFGITHPRTPLDMVHGGENQSFHAKAPIGTLTDVMTAGSWKDLPKVLPPSERPGEPLANHAPTITRTDSEYLMIYGPRPLRYATSPDLMKWTPRGRLDNGVQPGRDPSLLYHDGTFFLLTCDRAAVHMSTSHDLHTWKSHGVILKMKRGIDPESPTMVRTNNTFYLFVCGWDGIWDKKDLAGAYQHITYVYQSDNPFHFDADNEVTRLDAHAPEIFPDEEGQWFISSAEFPVRGVSLAPLRWE
jgi:beta-fructofuranosidase